MSRSVSKNPNTQALQEIEKTRSIGSWLPWAGFAAALIWWGGAAGTALALIGPGQFATQSPVLIFSLVLLAILPGLLMIQAGLMARASLQSREANAMVLTAAARLLAPSRDVRVEAETMADATRRCAAEITSSMGDALAALKAVSKELAAERLRVESVSYVAADNARDLTERLTAERTALEKLTRELKEQMSLMGEAIPRQAALMVDAAKAAKLEVTDADAALETRLGRLTNASSELAGKLTSLDEMAVEAASRAAKVEQSVATMESKLDKSRTIVSRAEAASSMAVDAVSAAGRALETAVSSALDGARDASAEITERSGQAREAAAIALADLRTAGRDAAQAIRELRLSATDLPEIDGPTHILSHSGQEMDAKLSSETPAALTHEAATINLPESRIESGDGAIDPPPVDEYAPESAYIEQPSPLDTPPIDAELEEAASPGRLLNGALPTSQESTIIEADLATPGAEDSDDLFEGDTEEILPAGAAAPEPSPGPIRNKPSLFSRPPAKAQAPARAPDLGPADPGEAMFPQPRKSAQQNGTSTDWRDILAELEAEPTAKPTASAFAPAVPEEDTAPRDTSTDTLREETAEVLIERLMATGIKLPDTFRPREKKKIAAAAREGDEARRLATRSAAGREVDRVEIRIRKDKELHSLAQMFLDAEEEDALRTLEETSRISRNASSRLSAYLLLDAAIHQSGA